MRIPLLLLFLTVFLHGSSQVSTSFTGLRNFVRQNHPQNIVLDSSANFPMYDKKGINYLLPFYKAFYYEKETAAYDTAAYYQNLSEALAFVGDQKSIVALRKFSDQQLPFPVLADIKRLVDSAKDLVYEDARRYILSKTKNSRVVMINESHDNPMHRAFTTSLLGEMYAQGYRYLAMDMFANAGRRTGSKLNINTGHYVCEPVAGELVRKAIALGYTLLPYEDTVAQHTLKQREYAQAANIAGIFKTDPAAKILVHAGYGHTREIAYTDDFIPMAAYFKIVAGIDPLTVDQVLMSESAVGSFGYELYQQWLQKHPVTVSSVALSANKSVDIGGDVSHDLFVIHPVSKYSNERPTWMAMNGQKEITVSAAYKTCFLVQAYYLNEYNEKTVDLSIPADQTYNDASDGLYSLYLLKGVYKIVFRDKNYAVLGSRDIEVK